MNKTFLFILLLGICFSCQQSGNKGENTKPALTSAAIKTIDITVEGMTCTGCENAIQESVKNIEGISSVKADYKAGKVTVSYDSVKNDLAAIKEAIQHTGYKVID